MLEFSPSSRDQLFVWVFIPHYITENGLVNGLDSLDQSLYQELVDVFAELKIQWKWQPVTTENLEEVVEEIITSPAQYIPVVLNYCVGDEFPNLPGSAVYELLEKKGIPSTGADLTSICLSSSKLRMKQSFIVADVSTAPYETISNLSEIEGICNRLGTPLIVKPAIACGSRGISIHSVVHNDEQVAIQIQQLLKGKHGLQFSLENIFVESFINGPEFTVFLIGSAKQPEKIQIYPPIERVFHSALPELERFLSHDRYFEKYQEETALSSEEAFTSCQAVDADLANKLCDLAKSAYCSMNTSGFGRVDIRMDKVSSKLFVLEVNPNCHISSSQSSSMGKILHISGIPFSQLVSEIIYEALLRNACLNGMQISYPYFLSLTD
jgi:D-alanine-D-alanine ligase